MTSSSTMPGVVDQDGPFAPGCGVYGPRDGLASVGLTTSPIGKIPVFAGAQKNSIACCMALSQTTGRRGKQFKRNTFKRQARAAPPTKFRSEGSGNPLVAVKGHETLLRRGVC